VEKQWLGSAIKCELFLLQLNRERKKKCVRIANSFSDRRSHLGLKHDLPIIFSFSIKANVGMAQSFNGAEM